MTARRLAETILRDPQLAADAVQEAFVSLWLLGGAYDPERGGYDALLRTLVHRRAVDILRRRGPLTQTVPMTDTVVAALADPTQGPESSYLAADRAREALVAIRALTPVKRQALLLSCGSGQSHAEIAKLLGVSLGTVKARIRAAKKELREKLAAAADSIEEPNLP